MLECFPNSNLFIDDEDIEYYIDDGHDDHDDDRSSPDYGIIGVLDCSVINCPLFPQAV